MSEQGNGPIRPIQGPLAPNHGRPPVGAEAETQAGTSPGNVVNLFSSKPPSEPHIAGSTQTAPSTMSPVAAPKPATGDTLVSGQEPPVVKLSDSAARRQIAELEETRKRREKEEADRRAAAEAARRVQTNPLPILPPPPPSSIDGAERAVRQDAADRADSRMPEQAAERRDRKTHWGRIAGAMAISTIAIIAIAAGTSGEKPIVPVPDPGPSSTATATPTSSVTTKPTSKPTATAVPTPTTTAPSPSPCVPVTQEWIDAQPWAADRKGNDMSNFSVQNWPKSLNCGKNDANMKWVDAKHVDISGCCH